MYLCIVIKYLAFQARALLDTSELSLLMFLLGQYRGHQMSITPLVTRSVEGHMMTDMT